MKHNFMMGLLFGVSLAAWALRPTERDREDTRSRVPMLSSVPATNFLYRRRLGREMDD